MSDAIHEQLSAFLDGELSHAESELLLKRIERDSQLKEQFERYVLAGEALRATSVEVRPSRDFSVRITRAIDGESSGNLPARAKQAAQWLKPVAGGAIAASVAAAALVTFQVGPFVAGNNSPMTPASGLTANVDGALPAANGGALELRAAPIAPSDSGASFTVPVASDPKLAPPIRVITNSRLANYVVAHSEYSSPLSRRNVLTGLVAEEPAGDQLAESFIVEPFDVESAMVEQWAADGEKKKPVAEPKASDSGSDQMLSRGPR